MERQVYRTRRLLCDRLDLHHLARTEADLEVGEVARLALGAQIDPGDSAAPAVVDVDPVLLHAVLVDLDSVSIDDHLVSGRVDLDRRAELKVVGDGGPESVVPLAPLADDGSALVAELVRLLAELLRSAGRAGGEVHVDEGLRPLREVRALEAGALGVVAVAVESGLLGRAAAGIAAVDEVVVERDEAVDADVLRRLVGDSVSPRPEPGQVVGPAPVAELLSARRRHASADDRERREIAVGRALVPRGAEKRIEEGTARVRARRAGLGAAGRGGGGRRVGLPFGVRPERRVRLRLVAALACAGHHVHARGVGLGLGEVVRRKLHDRRAPVAAGHDHVSRRGEVDDPEASPSQRAGHRAVGQHPPRHRAPLQEGVRRRFGDVSRDFGTKCANGRKPRCGQGGKAPNLHLFICSLCAISCAHFF